MFHARLAGGFGHSGYRALQLVYFGATCDMQKRPQVTGVPKHSNLEPDC